MLTSIFLGNVQAVRIRVMLLAALMGLGFGVKVKAQQSSPALAITSPQEGTIVNSGAQLPVTVSASTPSDVAHLEIVGEDMGIAVIPAGTTFSTSITIPANIIGERKLVAVASTTSGSLIVSTPVDIDVELGVEAAALSVSPSQLSFEFPGQQLPLTVTATLADGSTVDVTKSSRTIYSTSDTTIATVDSGGLVTAGSGATANSIVAKYQTLSATVSVSVPNTIPGDLDGNGTVDQDDLSVLLDAIAAGAQVTGSLDARDLNHDGVIDFRDAIALEKLCSRPGCATREPSPFATPPVTTAVISPPPNQQNWNNTDVTVSLTSTVNNSGAGVKQIQFALSGAQQGVSAVLGNTASLGISLEGITTLDYFAVGIDGTTEKPQSLTVQIDKTPPTLFGLPAAGCTLWPPNQKMDQVATTTASDSLSGLAAFDLAVTSNEPMDPSDPDIVVSGDGLQPRVVQLRAERAGSGSGRVYTFVATATDVAGNTTKKIASCSVPHDQR